ncbi:Hypp3399 [Branchiostoma lanceolatum]|uniref:Hypp3399 protein n=1 Tax=Branchiostoma lanceolatum TaxID=7740 RepID=A0A8K0A2D2_BRALA|nr:Hypp3399 [Branchiostoma lanceolatum]
MADEGPTATLPALYIPPLIGPEESQPAVGEAMLPAVDDIKLPFLSGMGGEALAEEVLRAPPEGDEAENLDLLSPDKLPPLPHPPVRPKREKMRYITFTAEATRHTKELKRTKRRRFSLEQKTEEEENAKKSKGPMGPEECLRCALRMEHAQCEPHKYIRVGGGFRHSYWYCKLIIQKMQEEAEDEVRMLLFDAESVGKEAPNIRVRADGTVERKIKTYVRTKSGRRIVKYHYVDDKTFQKLQQLREKGRKLGHGADFDGWEPWGDPTPEPSVKEFGESDIGSDKEIIMKDGKMFIRRKRRDSALGSDDDDEELEVEVIEQIVGYTADGKPIIKKIYRTVAKKKKGADDRPDSGLSYSTKGGRRHRRHGSGGSSRSGSRHGGRRRHRRHGSGGSDSVVSSYSYDSKGNVTRKKHRRRRRSRSGSGSGRGRHRRRGGGGRRRRDSKGSYSSYSSYSDRGSGKGRRRRGRRRRSGSRGSRDSRGHRRRRHKRHDSQGNSYSEYSDYSSRSGSRGGGRRKRRGKDGRSRRSRSRGGRRRRRRGSGSSYSSSYYSSSSSYESTEYDSEGRAKPKKKKEKRDRRGRGRGHGRDRHGRRRRSVSSDSTDISSDSDTTVSSVLDLEDEDDPNITEEERQARKERNRAKVEAHEKKREEKKVAREKRREEKRIKREEQKERRKDREVRRRRRGSYSSSDESTWGDGKTAVKYGKGSRRDGKMRKDGRDIGYDDPNDPWNKGKKGKKGKKDKKPRADGTYSSSSEETTYDEHGNKMPKKKKDKKKKKSGWFSSSSSETETEESIYEERIRADGTIEKVKVGTKKVKKKKDKKWKYRQKSADTEYDSVGSAEAEKMVFREVMDEFGNIIRLTKSGRRIKDGKISKERYDWEGKAKRRRERIDAGLEPKPPSPEYEEEEIVEEYIDEEGNVVRTVRKVLKRKPGTGPPGREEEPLTGLRRVNQIFRKGGEQMLQRLKNLIAACELDDDMFLTDIDERDSSIDFLSHYHLIDRNKLEGYAKAFIVEDLDEDNILNLQETRIALEGIQSITNVSRKQTDYVLRVLGIDDSTHVTFRMFAVIAALCERMCTLDYKEKYWMELTNLMDIERKMALYKAMFYCNVNSDRSANYIKADSLRIELIAGGLNRYQEEYIMSRIQINEYREVSFLDYMAYIPLFLSMHEKICDNPLDNSRNKYAMRVGSPVMRDQMPLGLPLRLAAASMKPFKVPQEILDEVEALSTLDTLKTAPNMVRLRALKMKQRGMTKSTSTTSLEKWNADATHNMANNIATLIGGVSQ